MNMPRPETPLARYMRLRADAQHARMPDGPELVAVQQRVGEWLTQQGILDVPAPYGRYDRGVMERQMLSLVDYLGRTDGGLISDVEAAATDAFIDVAFRAYGTPREDEEAAASFAFVVPMRASRLRPEFGAEVEYISPVLRYVPTVARARLSVGLPPLVLDTYSYDGEHPVGYLVLAPVFTDMAFDMEPLEALALARHVIEDTVAFSVDSLGARLVGLGAVLPALTRFGTTLSETRVVTTTGHGGTVYLILEMIEHAVTERIVDPNATDSLGVLGLGSIGASIAHLLAERYPDSDLWVYDTNPAKVQRTLAELPGSRVRVAGDEGEVLERAGVTVSAIVGEVDLSRYPDLSLRGKLILDDSQPSSFDGEVRRRGGTLAWVIGRDLTGRLRRSGYGYGFMVNETHDLFGCEAEVASLALESTGQGPRAVEQLALRGPVTPSGVRGLTHVLQRHGMGPAPFQAFGEPAIA